MVRHLKKLKCIVKIWNIDSISLLWCIKCSILFSLWKWQSSSLCCQMRFDEDPIKDEYFVVCVGYVLLTIYPPAFIVYFWFFHALLKIELDRNEIRLWVTPFRLIYLIKAAISNVVSWSILVLARVIRTVILHNFKQQFFNEIKDKWQR